MSQSFEPQLLYPVPADEQFQRSRNREEPAPHYAQSNERTLLIVAILIGTAIMISIIVLIVVILQTNTPSSKLTTSMEEPTPTQIILPSYTPFPTEPALPQNNTLQIPTLPPSSNPGTELYLEKKDDGSKRIPGESLTLNTSSGRVLFQSNIVQGNNAPIMRVGKETLYQSDLQNQLPHVVSINNQQARITAMESLQRESIILQAGEDEGMISLDSTVFDSRSKDYEKRQNLVQRVLTTVANDSAVVEGKILSMWFYTEQTRKGSYGEAQEYVRKQIQDIYNRLSQRTLSIESAAEIIRSDINLKDIDPLYQQNAIFTFRAEDGDDITIFPEVNDIIWSLDVNEVSEIMTGSTSYGDEYPRESVYMIAVLTSKQNPNDPTAFDVWYKINEDDYNINIY